jgi:hypothetical protein
MVKSAKPFYDTLAHRRNSRLTNSPAAVDAAIAKLPPDQVFARTIAPALKPIRFPIAKAQAMDAMLRQRP